jgi:hypothetical protein
LRYQRVDTTISGTTTKQHRVTSGATNSAAPDRQNHGDHRDQRLGHREPHDLRHLVDVARRARQQVTRAGPLDRPQRQRQDPVEERLAQLAQHLLTEPV